jgi:hypothetical protein
MCMMSQMTITIAAPYSCRVCRLSNDVATDGMLLEHGKEIALHDEMLQSLRALWPYSRVIKDLGSVGNGIRCALLINGTRTYAFDVGEHECELSISTDR